MNESKRSLRVGVAQFPVTAQVSTAEVLAEVGSRVRDVVGQACLRGARLVVFPEGGLCFPHKRLISSCPTEVAEADWTKVDWGALRRELEEIAASAREHATWVVIGAPHWRGSNARPHNSLFVFSDRGRLVTRYDKRRLSSTEVNFLYAPGIEPVTFDVDGFRVGLILCLETIFPELFVEYADEGADLIVISSAGGGIFGQLAHSYAAITGTCVALAIPPSADDLSTSGLCGPRGWIGRLLDGQPGLAIVDVPRRDSATQFHFQARHGLYDDRLEPNHPRTLDRTSL